MHKRYLGLTPASKAWLIAKISLKSNKLVVVTQNEGTAEELYNDLLFFSLEASLFRYPAWGLLPFEPISPVLDITAERLKTLLDLQRAEKSICVTSVEALLQKILALKHFEILKFDLLPAQYILRSELLKKLNACGFRSVSLVEEVGDMAVRGAVVDLFPSTTTGAVRLEFDADVLQKIKLFDVQSQRSTENLNSLQIFPVAERFSLPDHPSLCDQLPAALLRLKSRAQMLQIPLNEQMQFIEALEKGLNIPGVELLQLAALAPLENFFDLIPKESLLITDDKIAIENNIDTFWEHLKEREERFASESHFFPSALETYLSSEEFNKSSANFEQIFLDNLQLSDLEENSDQALNLRSLSNIELVTRLKTKVGSGHALQPLKAFLTKVRTQNFRVVFVVGSNHRSERLKRLLLDIDCEARSVEQSGLLSWIGSPNSYPIVIATGHISAGFQLPNEKLVFISEAEIFAERSYRQTRKSSANIKRLLTSLSQLKEEDYVVHVDYGIGIYRGLKHLKVDGAETDLLHIDYADSRLFLPIQNIGKIQKFNAAEGKAPALDKLSSKRWTETKRKVRESVATLAGELIKLYATRSIAKGWRFDPYGAEDERFADGFAYNETPDQLKAIEETLSDMAKDKPMDRMVCGDVGFGKTEVAVRAAFKCVEHARQVAILVPTTLLAEQHRETFTRRFLGYPVRIEAISRLNKPQKNKEIIKELAEGKLDVIIGTHRLLSKDVAFPDLGLVIIDEEHRFGVKQKEKLKQLKKQVDVLTLTATPIPRTLHMSLLGIRDISLINTPPHDRRLIRTYVASQDDALVRDAILREIQRAGQCFYLYNRVESIELATSRLAELVPEARFSFAHGQMSEMQLEKIMTAFIKKEIDVLVSTTIIESGLDIPNANTILIERADSFGLAQLYQLRGRVGRSARQAYAYFLVPKTRKLGSDAQKRLKVLQSLDDLGQGFNLAIRDLEIRGAGNLLGREQSGNVLLVGFELYTKILKEAILNLKGEELELEEIIDPEVKFGFDAYLPQTYIPDISERLVLYQRLASIASPPEAYELMEEVADRFGPLPDAAENLIELMRLRSLLKHFGITKVELSDSKLALAFSSRAKVDPKKLLKLIQTERNRYKFSKSQVLSINLEQSAVEKAPDVYSLVDRLLKLIETD